MYGNIYIEIKLLDSYVIKIFNQIYIWGRVTMAITDIFPIEDMHKGLTHRIKDVVEKVEQLFGASQLLSNDVKFRYGNSSTSLWE